MTGALVTAVCFLLVFIALVLGIRDHNTSREDRAVMDAFKLIQKMGGPEALEAALSETEEEGGTDAD